MPWKVVLWIEIFRMFVRRFCWVSARGMRQNWVEGHWQVVRKVELRRILAIRLWGRTFCEKMESAVRSWCPLPKSVIFLWFRSLWKVPVHRFSVPIFRFSVPHVFEAPNKVAELHRVRNRSKCTKTLLNSHRVGGADQLTTLYNSNVPCTPPNHFSMPKSCKVLPNNGKLFNSMWSSLAIVRHLSFFNKCVAKRMKIQNCIFKCALVGVFVWNRQTC